MSLNKLATNPWSPTISAGRKILRTRNGKALNRLKSPYRIFWTFDDGGANDPDLLIWHDRGIGTIVYNPDYSVAGQINLPGSLPVYTCKSSNRYTEAVWESDYIAKTRYWAILTYNHPSSEGRQRGMTFWILGQKIHVTAQRTEFVEDAETYLGYVTYFTEPPLDAWPREYAVNDIYRGAWPAFII